MLRAVVAQLVIGDAEPARGFRLIAAALAQRFFHQLALERFDAILERAFPRSRWIERAKTEIVGRQLLPGLAIHRALDDVLQLAHVAGKGITLEHRERALAEALATERRHLAHEALEEELREQRDVADALAQRRHADLF